MPALLNRLKNKMTEITNFFTQQNKKPLAILVTILFLLILTMLITLTHHAKSTTEFYSLQNKRNEIILHKLNDINESVHTLESNPTNTHQQKAVLETLQNDIVSIRNSINNTVKSTDIQKISGQLNSIKDDIDSRISDLKKVVSQGNDSKEYLYANALPFQIISVDIIAGQSYATVDYDNHIWPLTVGDFLAGWRIIYVDYDPETIELINEKNQHVKIKIRGT